METTFPPPTTPAVERGAWTLTWGEHHWSEDDLTGAHAALVSLLAATDSYQMLDPISGPMALLAVLTAFIAIAETRDPQAVMAELSATSVKRLLDAVSVS